MSAPPCLSRSALDTDPPARMGVVGTATFIICEMTELRFLAAPALHPPGLRAATRYPVIALVLAGLAACGGGGSEPTGPPVAASLVLISGGDQIGPVGAPLSQPIIVEVRSQQGPLPGAGVNFVVEGGTGSVSRSLVVTDALGAASVTWFLGGLVGEQRLRISAGTLPTLSVRATALIGPPAQVIAVAGNGQLVVVKRAVPIRPRVRVADAFGNALSGQPVVFAVIEGGGTITDSVHTTDAGGEATLGSWTLGPAAGANRVRATSGNQAGVVTAFGTAAKLIAIEGDAQSVNAGTLAPVRPAVQALDGDDGPLPNVPVTFAVQGGGGLVLGASQATDAGGIARVGGWILGVTPGPNQLHAAAQGVPPTQFTATGVLATPASLALVAGDGLSGFFGNFLAGAPEVRVTDGGGAPVAGATVSFAVASGGGLVASASPRSDFDGRAALGAWRLGTGELTQTVQAVVAGLPPVTFTATAGPPPVSEFDIEVRFVTTPTPTQQAAFTNAAARWEQIILGDLENAQATFPAGGCLPVDIDEEIDDVIIFAELVAIDGPGGVLGSAGPCLIRDVGLLTGVGVMRFDLADLTNLETAGLLQTVIVHEMAHVLGFGTLWSDLDLIVGEGGTDPFFIGAGALAAFAAATAPQTFPGNAVPVEGLPAGPGTADGHWREANFDAELMTGFVDQGSNPLSAVTSTSFRDMGYVVDDALSDPYTLAAFLRALGPAGRSEVQLIEVPLPGPIYVIDRRGRITRVIFR